MIEALVIALLAGVSRLADGATSCASMPRTCGYGWQSLANTSWAFANLELMDLPLLQAISSKALIMLANFEPSGWHRRDLVALAMGLLGIAWAHSFLTVDLVDLGIALEGNLRRVGLEVQRRDALALEKDSRDHTGEELAAQWMKAPRLDMLLPGIAVIHKPPDWEVDGSRTADRDTDEGSLQPLRLSSWLQAQLPRSQCPVSWDAALDFGFLHRLDVPSSGLILCGTTFQGLMSLRWQLDTYKIERQYIVWGHDLASASLREVVANIDPRTVDSKRSYVSEVHGKPAQSWFVVPAHLRRRDAKTADAFSALAVRIRTGRRHQIRAHLLHAGHPTATDCKYAAVGVHFAHFSALELDFLRAGAQSP
mmetsp:Transcript_31843/g.89453  ORF Transcript_31843/g.89453 Transcript_31843/m.89453 type:complete len:366 (-) Transcript_31843:88-1185(-)